ncbi:MAG: large repetitive protein [Thermoanaerobaculia bacterium]|jgi:hypothetical protein|nr:large repetitive protein [Thermoanaerobaculia bacterium]
MTTATPRTAVVIAALSVFTLLAGAAQAQLPSLSIDDAELPEGSGYSQPFLSSYDGTPFTFNVTLSAPSTNTVSVFYTTVPGTAGEGFPADYDYIRTSGRLTFAPGETLKTVTVLVYADFSDEPTETFTVRLSGEGNATIARADGIGTILNDDPPPTNGDLGLTIVSAPTTIHVGDTGTITFQIINNGPGDVSAVSWQVNFWDGVTATASQGEGCQRIVGGEGEGYTYCRLDTIASGATATVTMTVHQLYLFCANTFGPFATVSSPTNTDPNSANDKMYVDLNTWLNIQPIVTPPALDLTPGTTQNLSIEVATYAGFDDPLQVSAEDNCISVPATAKEPYVPNQPSIAMIPVTAVSAPCTTHVVFTRQSCPSVTYRVPITTHAAADGPSIGLSDVFPNSGSTNGSTLVRLTGHSFKSDCWPFFDGMAAHNVIVEGSASLVASTPRHAGGTVSIALRCSGTADVVLNNAFTYVAGDDPAPLITSIDMLSAAPGQQITIRGLHFRTNDTITFGSAAAISGATTADTHVATVPSLPPGVVSVNVTDVLGRLSTTGPIFTVLSNTPQITHVAPTALPAGAELAIDGSGFRAPFTFTIGGQTARIVTMSFNRAIVRVPALAPGNYELRIVNGSQTASGGTLTVTQSGLMIVSAYPVCARTDGGAVLHILGSGFAAGATVTIGGVAATSVTVIDASHIDATLPSLPPGWATIVVRNSTGETGSATNAIAVYSPFDPDGCPVSPRQRPVRR